MIDISERSFEQAIECALLAHGPDACGSSDTIAEPSTPYSPANDDPRCVEPVDDEHKGENLSLF